MDKRLSDFMCVCPNKYKHSWDRKFKYNFFVWVIMAILLAKSDVNGLKDKVWFWRFDLKSGKNNKKSVKKHIDPFYIGPN